MSEHKMSSYFHPYWVEAVAGEPYDATVEIFYVEDHGRNEGMSFSEWQDDNFLNHSVFSQIMIALAGAPDSATAFVLVLPAGDGARNNANHVIPIRKLPLAILNTSIVTADGTYEVQTVSPDVASEIVDQYGKDGIDSAVGHPATAKLLSELLEINVPVSRKMFVQQPGQQALVFKLNGRPEPGKELSMSELFDIGFTFKVLTRTQ